MFSIITPHFELLRRTKILPISNMKPERIAFHILQRKIKTNLKQIQAANLKQIQAVDTGHGSWGFASSTTSTLAYVMLTL